MREVAVGRLPGEARFAMPLSSDRVVFGSVDPDTGGHLFAMGFATDFHPVIVTGTAATPITTGAPGPAEDVSLWFGGGHGELFRGRFEMANDSVALELVSREPSGAALIQMLLREESADREVLALSAGGEVVRFARGAWSTLHRFPPPASGTTSPPGALVACGNRALAALATTPFVAWISADQVEVQLVSDDPAVGSVSAAACLPGRGAFVGTTRGRLLLEDRGAWTNRSEESTFGWIITAIALLGEEVFFASPRGFVGSYRPSAARLCEPKMVVPFNVSVLATFGARLMAGGSVPESQPQVASVSALTER